MDRTTAEGFATEAAAGARRRVEDFVSGVKDQAQKLKQRSVDDVWGGAVEYVKSNPGKAVLFSLAVGVVLGSILRRRGD